MSSRSIRWISAIVTRSTSQNFISHPAIGHCVQSSSRFHGTSRWQMQATIEKSASRKRRLDAVTHPRLSTTLWVFNWSSIELFEICDCLWWRSFSFVRNAFVYSESNWIDFCRPLFGSGVCLNRLIESTMEIQLIINNTMANNRRVSGLRTIPRWKWARPNWFCQVSDRYSRLETRQSWRTSRICSETHESECRISPMAPTWSLKNRRSSHCSFTSHRIVSKRPAQTPH